MHLVRARADTEGRCASSGTRRAFALVAVGALVWSTIGSDTDGVLRSTAADAAEPAVLVGAGDIANSGPNDDATANLLNSIPGTVFTAGDNAYSDGSTSNFQQYYEPTWGRHKARTRPSPGNHDYHISGAADYFTYFGASAGEAGKGFYSYDLGSWHIISLNSNCSDAGSAVGCTATSPQVQWLRSDLAASSAQCTIAYWHHPLFTSGEHSGASSIKPFWDALYEFRADIVLNGHNHQYERFAPQTPTGARDDANGIREFVVGTGGAGAYGFGSPEPNSEARSENHGVIKLTLNEGSYAWEFLSIPGSPSFVESGTGNCVGGSGPTPSPTATPTSSPSSSPTASPSTPPPGGTTFERRIATGNDDAEESSSGSVSLGSSDLELVTDSSNVQTVGLRFPNITIPAGATVTSAWVQFKVDETSTGSAPLTINAERVANAAPFTTSSRNVSSRIRTGASASWSPPDWTTIGAVGTAQRTSDLASVIGEVFALPGWASGNAIVIILTGTGRRTAKAYNGDTAGAPLLHVDYASGMGPSPSTSTSTSPSPSPSTSPSSSTSASPSPVPSGTVVTLERRIATGNDDAEERSGSVDLSSSDLEMVLDGSSVQTIGLRFTNLPVPVGATIVNAWVQFKVDENPASACSLTIQGQAIDNAPVFTTSSSNVSSRARTAASVAWSPPPWPTVGASGPDQRTPDLKSVIAQVTGRAGWASGNAIVLIITGSGKRIADSYNGDAAGAPLLHIEYTA